MVSKGWFALLVVERKSALRVVDEKTGEVEILQSFDA